VVWGACADALEETAMQMKVIKAVTDTAAAKADYAMRGSSKAGQQ
jgi:hypothetical protein